MITPPPKAPSRENTGTPWSTSSPSPPEALESRIALFKGRVGWCFHQFRQRLPEAGRSPAHHRSHPARKSFLAILRDKIACEERLLRAFRDEQFPVVIIRPSLTYGDTIIPLAINSWQKSYTAVDRMRRGLPVIVPGDGLTRWTITHNSDFAPVSAASR